MTKKLFLVASIASLIMGHGGPLIVAAFIWWCAVMVLAACKGYPHHDR